VSDFIESIAKIVNRQVLQTGVITLSAIAKQSRLINLMLTDMISEEFDQNPDPVHALAANSSAKVLTEEVFSLLSEHLLFGIERRKVGEIVVRREIETHVIQVAVPIRHEKLIVEQVSPVYKLLAEVTLGQTNNDDGAIPNNLSSIERDDRLTATEFDNPMTKSSQRSTNSTVYGTTDSLQAASALLSEIANRPTQDCGTVRIEIVLKDAKHRDVYQTLVDRHFRV
jgi:Domain of unknown function (DUF2382)